MFESLLKGFVESPLPSMLVVAILTGAYLYKAREADRVARDAERTVVAAQIQKLNDDHKSTIEKVIPVADKLADATIAIERSVATLERLKEKQ